MPPTIRSYTVCASIIDMPPTIRPYTVCASIIDMPPTIRPYTARENIYNVINYSNIKFNRVILKHIHKQGNLVERDDGLILYPVGSGAKYQFLHIVQLMICIGQPVATTHRMYRYITHGLPPSFLETYFRYHIPVSKMV